MSHTTVVTMSAPGLQTLEFTLGSRQLAEQYGASDVLSTVTYVGEEAVNLIHNRKVFLQHFTVLERTLISVFYSLVLDWENNFNPVIENTGNVPFNMPKTMQEYPPYENFSVTIRHND